VIDLKSTSFAIILTTATCLEHISGCHQVDDIIDEVLLQTNLPGQKLIWSKHVAIQKSCRIKYDMCSLTPFVFIFSLFFIERTSSYILHSVEFVIFSKEADSSHL